MSIHIQKTHDFLFGACKLMSSSTCSATITLMAYNPEENETGRQLGAQAEREWMVEYIIDIPEVEPIRNIAILRGREMSDVQSRLYDILRAQFVEARRLDVTVIRMEPVDMRTDSSLFEIGGAFAP